MKVFKFEEQKCLVAGIQCAIVKINRDTKRRKTNEQL